jgi:transposase InsO family protein
MKHEHPLAALCAALAVSRSGYYRWKDAEPGFRARQDAQLTEAIRAVHRENRGVYGSPRVTRALRKRGLHHSRKRVARLMQAEGLRGKCPRRWVPCTTQSAHAHPIAPNRLAEHPKPSAPNQVWVSDITYVRTAEGWLYVAAILDLYSRRIVGWATGASLAAELVLAALAMARLHRRPPAGLLYHSDRGVQYACGDFRAALADAQLVASMSRRGNCYDNAAMESFWSSFKRECAHELYPTRGEGTAAAFDYIETFYNRVRLHSALGYQSPVDFENQLN